jgi:hypothetical protein
MIRNNKFESLIVAQKREVEEEQDKRIKEVLDKSIGVEDLWVGITIYTSSAEFGVEKIVLLSKPYESRTVGSLFAEGLHYYEDTGIEKAYKRNFSLMDRGIISNTYNGRKSFKTKEDAQKWIEMSKGNPKYDIRNDVIEAYWPWG